MEAICDLLKSILHLIDPNFVFQGAICPFLNGFYALINISLYLTHNISFESSKSFSYLIYYLLLAIFYHLTSSFYVVLTLFQHLFDLHL